MRVRNAPIVAVAASLALAGCSLMRTHYSRPAVNVPARYEHADDNAKASLNRWWENFGDSHLNAVIDQALSVNSDLALAALNIRAAQLQIRLAIINPTVTLGYTDEYSKALHGPVPPTRFRSLNASASYELDLWDQLGALKDVARWEARATEEDRQSAALILIGATVTLYYQVAALNYQIAHGKESIAYAQKTLDLVNVQANAGGASQLEVAQSQQSLESQEASQVALMEQRIETRNALTLLLNGTPWPKESEASAVPEGPPPVGSDLPASLLERRPDLRAAELRLRETLAQTDATRLSFYPNLNLTGSLGTASPGLAELVSNPLGSLAATLAAPFIQFNQAKFATALARTQYDKAVVGFRKTLLQALIDVDNALSARTQLALEGDRLEQVLAAARIAEHLTEVRYRAGAVGLQSWLDAQGIRRGAEITLSLNRLSRLENYAALCLALGGA
jgi:NodT family efflux transporter outer membrane factor (OMF) lipoprotein